MMPARQAFSETLLDCARRDPALFAVTTDSRGSMLLGDFAAALPNQLIECGIAEQNAVGIGAGVALAGGRPFVCGPACFLSLRSAEQIKLDVAYAGLNVKVIGVSGGVSYGPLGASHHAVQDLALLRAVPGIRLMLPADANAARSLTRLLCADDAPAYLRMGRGAVPEVYAEEPDLEIGQAVELVSGSDAVIIGCGEMVHAAVAAAQILADAGIQARVLDMHTIKPLDREAINAAAATGYVVTVEEHSVHGGLGGAVAETLADSGHVRLRIMGLPDEALRTGTREQMLAGYGLTPEGIAGTMQAMMEKRT